MSAPAGDLILAGEVAEAERPVLQVAARRLAQCLSAGGLEKGRLRIEHSPHTLGEQANVAVLLLSPLADAEGFDEIESIEARWREKLDRYREAGFRAIFLCKLFRHVASRAVNPVLLDRIRRINLTMVQLSQQSGSAVVDVDAALTRVGARALGADYRLASPKARTLAGFAFVSAIFEEGLDWCIAAEVEQKAREFHARPSGETATADA